MKVKCSQCGRIFEVPSTQTNRALKCVCKNIFIAEPMLVEVSEDKTPSEAHDTTPKAFDREDTLSFVNRYKTHEEVPDEATVASEPSDESSIAKHISLLKQGRQELSHRDSPPLPAVNASAQNSPGDISPALDLCEDPLADIPSFELDIRKPSSKEGVPSGDLSLEESTLEKPSDTSASQEAAAPMAVVAEQARPPRRLPPLPTESIIFLSAATLAGIALVIFLVSRSPSQYAALIGSKTESPQEDPYLSKLITHSSGVKKTHAPMAAESQPEPQAPEALQPREPGETKGNVAGMPTTPSARDSELQKLLDHYLAGNFQEVIRSFQAIRSPSADLKALYFESLIQRADDDESHLSRVLASIDNELRKSPESSDLLRSKGFALITMAKNHASLWTAEKLLKSLSQTQAFDPLIFTYLGMIYARLNDIPNARAAWDRALELEPDLVWLLDLQRDYFFAIGQPDEAYRTSLKLVEKAGQEARGYKLAAEIRIKQKQNAEALKLLQRSLKYKDSPDARLMAAKILEKQNPGAALSHIEVVLARAKNLAAPTLAEARLMAARLYCASQQIDKGQEIYALLLEKNLTKRLLIGKAECEIAGNKIQSAIATYERALKLDLRDSDLWLRYGQVLLTKAKPKASVEAALKSLKLKETVAAHTLAAKGLMTQRNHHEAKGHIRRALQLNPKSAEALELRKQIN